MKYILWTILSLLPLWSNETQDKILVMKVPSNPLLIQTLWAECSICGAEELRVILDCIKYRVQHKDFPNSLDSVLSQSAAFQTKTKEIVPIEFTKKIDSLWKLPIKYRYLYFRSKGYTYSSWMKRKWYKPKNMLHEYAK